VEQFADYTVFLRSNPTQPIPSTITCPSKWSWPGVVLLIASYKIDGWIDRYKMEGVSGSFLAHFKDGRGPTCVHTHPSHHLDWIFRDGCLTFFCPVPCLPYREKSVMHDTGERVPCRVCMYRYEPSLSPFQFPIWNGRYVPKCNQFQRPSPFPPLSSPPSLSNPSLPSTFCADCWSLICPFHLLFVSVNSFFYWDGSVPKP